MTRLRCDGYVLPSRRSRRGRAVSELLVGVLIVSIVLLGLLYLWTEDDKPTEFGIDVSPYRVANAVYAHNLLERYRLAVMNYIDMYGQLPGDVGAQANGTGRGDWRLERQYGEGERALADMADASVVPRGTLRVRGRELELAWVSLVADERELTGANYFVLRGFNRDEARAMDWKFDDGRNNDGDILYAVRGEDVVDLYMRLELDN